MRQGLHRPKTKKGLECRVSRQLDDFTKTKSGDSGFSSSIATYFATESTTFSSKVTIPASRDPPPAEPL